MAGITLERQQEFRRCFGLTPTVSTWARQQRSAENQLVKFPIDSALSNLAAIERLLLNSNLNSEDIAKIGAELRQLHQTFNPQKP